MKIREARVENQRDNGTPVQAGNGAREPFMTFKTRCVRIRQILGKRIRSLRESQGLSGTALAESLQLHHSAIARMESGARSVRAEELVLIAEILHVTPDYLLHVRPYDGTERIKNELMMQLQNMNEMIETMKLKYADYFVNS